MPYITEINADGELNTAAANFNAVCIANAIPLGLGNPDLTEIAAAVTGFNTALNTATASKATAHSSVTAKDTQKATTKTVIAKWAKVFRAKTTVTDALLDQLMLPPHKTPGTITAPATPTELNAVADGQGLISLKWNRNGNISTTSFVIEYQTGAGEPWTYLASVTKRTFEYQWTPGQYIAFRVSAVRRGINSAPSVPEVLWGTEAPLQLQVAA